MGQFFSIFMKSFQKTFYKKEFLPCTFLFNFHLIFLKSALNSSISSIVNVI